MKGGGRGREDMRERDECEGRREGGKDGRVQQLRSAPQMSSDLISYYFLLLTKFPRSPGSPVNENPVQEPSS